MGRGGVQERVRRARVAEGREKVEWDGYIMRLLSTELQEAMDLSTPPRRTWRAQRFRGGDRIPAIHLPRELLQ